MYVPTYHYYIRFSRTSETIKTSGCREPGSFVFIYVGSVIIYIYTYIAGRAHMFFARERERTRASVRVQGLGRESRQGENGTGKGGDRKPCDFSLKVYHLSPTGNLVPKNRGQIYRQSRWASRQQCDYAEPINCSRTI